MSVSFVNRISPSILHDRQHTQNYFQNCLHHQMEAARTSETSVDNYFTRQYIPEDKSELHTRRRENLKSHNYFHFMIYFPSTSFDLISSSRNTPSKVILV
jgi:hypothetical protein